MAKVSSTAPVSQAQFQQLQARYNKLEKWTYWKVQGNDPSTNWGLQPLIIGGVLTPSQLVIEIPSGAMNGSNLIFTLGSTVLNNFILLMLNGVYQEPTNDYTISGVTITFIVAPKASDYPLEALYVSVGT